MDKRVLLVGCNFSAAPLLGALKRRGLSVAVCGNIEGDTCHQAADRSFYIDYSDRLALLELVRQQAFDFLVPTGNDCSYLVSAWVAEKLGYAGFDPYKRALDLHTKASFRRLSVAVGLKGPRHWIVQEGTALPSPLPFPLLVKPSDNFSGRGVTKVDKPEALEKALVEARRHSREGRLVVEEFVEGQLYSHSAFVRKGRIITDFFVDEFCTVYPYQVNCSNHPSRLSLHLKEQVRAQMQGLVVSAGLVDGLLHTQFISDGDRFWIIEVMRRCPGDLYSRLIWHATAVDYADLFIRPFIGEEISAPKANGKTNYVVRHTVSRPQKHLAYGFQADFNALWQEVIPLRTTGQPMPQAPFGKSAVIFAAFDSAQTLHSITPRMADEVKLLKTEDIQ